MDIEDLIVDDELDLEALVERLREEEVQAGRRAVIEQIVNGCLN